ncbi:MAG: hypothetical protein ACLQFR_17715 [Streptosporangiaceae bacterium]
MSRRQETRPDADAPGEIWVNQAAHEYLMEKNGDLGTVPVDEFWAAIERFDPAALAFRPVVEARFE